MEPTKDIRFGMLRALDKAVGEIAKAIDSIPYHNTLLVFMSDNGAKLFPRTRPNYPLRGGKGTVFEGQ